MIGGAAAIALSLVLPVLGGLASAAVSDDARPNIIYVMVDDLGYGDLGCFGQQVIQTPNLDRMAREGMRMTDFYAGTTVCRPSRLVLWTGKHAGHTAISSNAQYVLPANETTVARLLQRAGYATGGVGKWALGNVENSGHPNRQGFDFWFGYLDQTAAHNYYPEFLWRNEEKIVLPGNQEGPDAHVSVKRTTYSHDVMTDEMFGFMRRAVAAGKPLLLHVHWTIPHANNQGGRATGDGMEVPDHGIYKDRDWPSPEKGYAAMITRMDRDMGRMKDLLKELKVDRNTLILFTSDNGPHNEGNHDHTFFDSNGPLRGYKRDLYEGGIRVPTIAWWPGVVPAGTTCATPLAFYDFLPTACELAKVAKPGGLDGMSFVPALRGESMPGREYLYWQYGDKVAVRMGKWKAVRLKDNSPIELYDLDADIGEEHDVAGQHEEIVERATEIIEEASSNGQNSSG